MPDLRGNRVRAPPLPGSPARARRGRRLARSRARPGRKPVAGRASSPNCESWRRGRREPAAVRHAPAPRNRILAELIRRTRCWVWRTWRWSIMCSRTGAGLPEAFARWDPSRYQLERRRPAPGGAGANGGGGGGGRANRRPPVTGGPPPADLAPDLWRRLRTGPRQPQTPGLGGAVPLAGPIRPRGGPGEIGAGADLSNKAAADTLPPKVQGGPGS